MTCAQVRLLLPGYLDGALPESGGPGLHSRLGQHLAACPECREELERYLDLSAMMSTVQMPPPPPELGVGIRMVVAKARSDGGVSGRLRASRTRLELVLQNILEPLALPATGGLVVALVVFAIVYQVLGAGMPLGAATPDSPTNLLQPARLEMLAGFQMSQLGQMTVAGAQHSLLVEATVNADGQAVDYRVISGTVDVTTRHELDQLLLFSRFRPQMSFGRPTSGGHVVLSFSQIRVRG